MTFRQILGTTVAQNVSLALYAIGGIVTARFLGPGDKGQLVTITLWTQALAVIATLGLPSAMTFFARREPERIAILLRSAVAAGAAAAVMVLVIAEIAMPALLGDTLSERGTLLLRLYLLAVPFWVLGDILYGLALGEGRYRTFNGILLVQTALYAAIPVLLEAGGALSLTTAIAAAAAAQIPLFTLGVTGAMRRARGRFERSALAKQIRFGLRALPADQALFFSSRSDQALLALVLPASGVGLYAAATSGTVLLLGIAAGASAVVFSTGSGLPEEESAQLTATSARITTAATGFAALAAGVVAPELLRLVVGASYVPATTAFRVLLVSTVALACSRVLMAGMNARGRPEIGLRAQVITLAVMLTAVLPLGAAFGINGASFGSLAAFTTGLIYLARHTLDGTQLAATDLWRPTRADIDAVRKVVRRPRSAA